MTGKKIRPAAINLMKQFFVLLVFCALPLISNCYQRLEKLNVSATDEGIIFSHPAMEDAIKQGNRLVFGEISVSRRSAADDFQEEMWSVQNTESGFQPTAELMGKSYIIYGENLPQTRILVEPKPLGENSYQVSGIVGIYNQNRELLKDLSFTNKFTLEKDASGKLIVSNIDRK